MLPLKIIRVSKISIENKPLKLLGQSLPVFLKLFFKNEHDDNLNIYYYKTRIWNVK
jgi:hypothetical protein